jgi:transcriptional regulator GlxA family with amidase domain
MTTHTRVVGILLFDDVEVLDFAGPFEVFGVTGKRGDSTPFEVVTVSQSGAAIRARNALAVTPTFSFATCPRLDILVLPGGYGTRREMHNAPVLEWLKERAREAEIVLSVCTGALLLAKAGLLAGLEVTTHHGAIELLRECAPDAKVRPEARYLDNGRIVTSAGISAGMDAALHVVARLLGQEQATETAEYMEYSSGFALA